MNRQQRRAQETANRLATKKANKRIHLSVVTNKCGSCNACCTVMEVQSMNSPEGEPCQHIQDKGCGIYKKRPQQCKDWNCVWKMGGIFLKHERPDKTGLVTDVTRNEPGDGMPMALVIREVWPGAIQENEKLLDRLVGEGRLLYLLGRDNRRVMGPPEKIEQLKAATAT